MALQIQKNINYRQLGLLLLLIFLLFICADAAAAGGRGALVLTL